MSKDSKSSLLSYTTLILFLIVLLLFFDATASHAASGTWQLLQRSVGVSAMHMQLLPTDRVILFDRTNFGPSNISLPKGTKCRSNDLVLKPDCTAHSVEYDVASNTFRPLTVLTDTWCSSGSLLPDGRLAQSGGSFEGERTLRVFDTNCKASSSCDWEELREKLLVPRWYASNHRLPDGRIIVVGGRAQFNYEFYPKTDATNVLQDLPFLSETNENGVENNLYPYIFVSVDGNLFVFANNRAILLDYTKNVVVRTYPTIPGNEPRSYPSTGSAVLLPLKKTDSKNPKAEVLVCGGAPKGAYDKALKGKFIEALDTCARIKITDPNPVWEMETMPMARAMGDMVLLPNGRVLIVNGVGAGSAGWYLGRKAVFTPVIYDPEGPTGSRFKLQRSSETPRVYHSTAVLLRDGRVLVGGSNTNSAYNFTDVLYPTDLSLEAFSPSYMDEKATDLRPTISSPSSKAMLKYGETVTVAFSVDGGIVGDKDKVKVTIVAPPFNTHSFSQGQRMVELTHVGSVTKVDDRKYEIAVKAPSTAVIAMPGYYMMFVVHQHVPSPGIWVKIQ